MKIAPLNSCCSRSWKDSFKVRELALNHQFFLFRDGDSGTVIEKLLSDFSQDPHVAVAYFYFDFRDPEKQTTSGMLLSLIHQLSVQVKLVPEAVFQLYDRYKGEKSRPSAQELSRLLVAIARQHYRKVFVVLDALDECAERKALLSTLRGLIAIEALSLLFTSRNEADVLWEFQRQKVMDVTIKSKDVAQDVYLFVTAQIEEDNFLRDQSHELKHEIVQSLVDGAKGMLVFSIPRIGRKFLTDRVKVSMGRLPVRFAPEL